MTEENKLINDLECEQLVLGTVIGAPAHNFPVVSHILNDACFYDNTNLTLWKAIRKLTNEGELADLVTLNRYFAKSGTGVMPIKLAEIATKQDVLHLQEDALYLRELAARRVLWLIGQRLVTAGCTSSGESVDEILEWTNRNVGDLFSLSGRHVLTLHDVFTELNKEIERNRADGQMIGTMTGFDFLDKTGGLHGGDLAVVAGESSMGKTSFATAMAMNAVRDEGAKIAFYSMEMSSRQLGARITAMYSGISSAKMLYRANSLTTHDLLRIYDAMNDNCKSGGTLYVDEASTSKLDGILASIRSMKLREGICGVVIDYLQIIDLGGSRGTSRADALENACRKFKNIAKDLDIWVVLLSQLNRSSGDDHVPTLDRLKGSGGIAEAADYVMFVYRPERWPGTRFPQPFENEEVHNKAMIDVQKGRNTGTGSFLCNFTPETTLFTYFKGEHEANKLQPLAGPTTAGGKQTKLPF